MQPFLVNRVSDENGPFIPEPRVIDVRRLVTYAALLVSIIAGTVAGFLVGPEWGLGALSVLTLIAAFLLGAE